MEYVIVIVQFYVLVNGNESGSACNMLAASKHDLQHTMTKHPA